jgi:SsrA-binding protein
MPGKKSRASKKNKKQTALPINRPLAINRQVRFNYDISETVEAGLVLTGTEIKSIRQGNVDIRDAYAQPINGELWLQNVHIKPYEQGNIRNHEPRRPRKLLLHRSQIIHFSSIVSEKRNTLVPLRIYIKSRVAKVLIGLGKGKRQYEKKQTLVDRAIERDTEREMKSMRY